MPGEWINVRVVDHSFGILDNGQIPAETSDYSTGLVITMATGARIHTGIDTGPVRVQATPTNHRPETPPDGTDNQRSEIVEASVNAPHGDLRIDSLDRGPVAGLPALSTNGPGWYRILVCAWGRDSAFDQVTTYPVEDYLILAWPQPTPSPPTVIRAEDRCGQSLHKTAPPHQPPPAKDTQPPAGRQRQTALRNNLLRAMGQPDSLEAADGRPVKQGPEQPAPKPR